MAHVITVVHGLAAGLGSLGVFYLAGLILLPRKWNRGGAGLTAVGAAFYVAGCWTAMTQRDLPLKYVMPLFVGTLVVIAIVRARSSLRSVVTSAVLDRAIGERVATFGVFYLLAYMLVVPAAGDSFLPLAPARNVELVTHARYARHALEIGTPDDLHLAPFGYGRSPVTSFVMAWQSIFFGGDPLSAALPTLFATTAVFGLIGVELLQRAGVSLRFSIAVLGIILSGPACRWVLAGFNLPEIVAASAVLLLATGLVRTAPAVAAALVLLVLAEPVSASWIWATLRAAGRVVSDYSPAALLGWPGRIAQVRSRDLIEAAPLVLPAMALVWLGIARVVLRAGPSERFIRSAADRQLSRALAAYVLVALIIGNVAVHAVRDPAAPRVTAGWRTMHDVNALPFRGLTLKMSDELDSLSTALALYFLPGKRATVIASDVTDEQVQYDTVTRQTPIFVQNLGCGGAGHDDIVAAGDIGCLLLAPPSPVLDRRYPFAGRHLFMSYRGLSPRLSDGRFNTRPTIPLRVTADPERSRLDRPLYANLLVRSLGPTASPAQGLVFRWGDRRAETSIAEPTWVSVPLTMDDWEGNRLWTVTIDMDFPGEHPIMFQEFSLSETPRGRLLGSTASP